VFIVAELFVEIGWDKTVVFSYSYRGVRECSLGQRCLKREPDSGTKSFSDMDFTFKSKVKIKELC